MDGTGQPTPKPKLSKGSRMLRALWSVVDPRAWLHLLKIVNYYNYTHVTPLRIVRMTGPVNISPDAVFSNAERIEIGKGTNIGSRCHIWAGHAQGRIVIGEDCLFGPEVMVTAASYRFNDGSPVTKQPMDEADVTIGRDVWLGTRAVVLPGVTIGDGAIIGAQAIVRNDIPANAIAVGQPARVVGTRSIGDGASA